LVSIAGGGTLGGYAGYRLGGKSDSGSLLKSSQVEAGAVGGGLGAAAGSTAGIMGIKSLARKFPRMLGGRFGTALGTMGTIGLGLGGGILGSRI
jgi:hypothetical protein